MPSISTETSRGPGRPPTEEGVQHRERALTYIVEYHRRHQYAPSTPELRELLGIGRTAVRWHLDSLAKDGLITFLPGEPSRTIVATAAGVEEYERIRRARVPQAPSTRRPRRIRSH